MPSDLRKMWRCLLQKHGGVVKWSRRRRGNKYTTTHGCVPLQWRAWPWAVSGCLNKWPVLLFLDWAVSWVLFHTNKCVAPSFLALAPFVVPYNCPQQFYCTGTWCCPELLWLLSSLIETVSYMKSTTCLLSLSPQASFRAFLILLDQVSSPL